MKEIVNRLQENRQVELAKQIMESNGYKVSQRLNESEEHAGWEYSEYTPGRGPWEADQYIKEYNGELYLVIYPPQAVPGEEYLDEWHAEIQGIYHATSIDGYETGFKSFEEAESWINSQVKNYDSEAEQSARDEKTLQDIVDRFEKIINSANNMPHYLKDAFKERAIQIIDSLK